MSSSYAAFYRFFGGLVLVLIILFVLGMWGDVFSKWLKEEFEDKLYEGTPWETERCKRRRFKRRQRKWKSLYKKQIRRNARKLDSAVRRDGRTAMKDALDSLSYSTAMHQEIIEEMYHQVAPTVKDVVRGIKRKRY